MTSDWFNFMKDLLHSEEDPRPAGGPDAPPSSPAHPAHIGSYRILREIAQGGMGIVYEATDPQGRRVAVKVLKPESSGGPSIQRLYREALVASQLRHPNIMTVHEVGSVPAPDGPTVHFICMDYIHGKTLADVMPSLSLRERIEVLETVARAVGHAHDKGIIHRDVKPQNILMEELPSPDVNGLRWRVVLTDFGLAQVDTQHSITRTGAVIGTTYYMAPEQIKGQTLKIGAHTDAWALGVILYEMITDTRPFEGDSILTLYDRIVRQDPVLPRKRAIALDPRLEAIAMNALEKETVQRYPDALSMADDLKRYLSDRPVSAPSVSRTRLLLKGLRRHSKTTAAMAGLGLMIVLAIAFAWMQNVKVAAAQNRAEQRKKVENALRPIIHLLDKWEWSGEMIEKQQAALILESFQKASEIDPQSSALDMEAGRLEWMKGNLVKAEDHFTRVVNDPLVKFLGHYYRARVRLARCSKERLTPVFRSVGLTTTMIDYSEVESETETTRDLRLSALSDLEAFHAGLGSVSSDPRLRFAEALAMFYRASTGPEYTQAAQRLEAAGQDGAIGAWEAYREAGTSYIYAGRFPDAVRLLRQASDRRHQDIIILYYFGYALLNLAYEKHGTHDDPSPELSEAIKQFNEVLAHQNVSHKAWISRGDARKFQAILTNSQDSPQYLALAIDDYTQAIKTTEDYVPSWNHRGTAYTMLLICMGKTNEDDRIIFEMAEKDFQKAIQLDPKSPAAFFNRGVLYLCVEQWEEAKKDFEKARSLDPRISERCRKLISVCDQRDNTWNRR